jgi:hypothetical protein
LIQIASDLVKKIAEERNKILQIIPLVWEYQPYNTKLIPVMGPEEKYLGVWSLEKAPIFKDPWIENQKFYNNFSFTIYPYSFENYQLLSQEILSLKPETCGVKPSFGTGDRLGLVSSAHLSVLKKYEVFPIVAQQSPRELKKTGRTFQSVLLDAAWGAFASGFRGRFGADADHIKDEYYLQQAIHSGYGFYTLDVSDYIEKEFMFQSEWDLNQTYQKMNPDQLDLLKRYLGRSYSLGGGFQVSFNEENLLRIVLSLHPVLGFIEQMNSILDERLTNYDLEISLDEGEVLTSYETHFFLSEELHRRGVDFQSLALKFPGSFEKGIDYRGDLNQFRENLQGQVLIAENIGGYRLSLHSGSDKMTIYPIFFEETHGLFHIKTSGTSWLKALETVSVFNPELFRKIYTLSWENYSENSRDYQVSFKINEIPADLEYLPDKKLQNFLKNDSVRQLLHISYGSILKEYREELYQFLFDYREDHCQRVEENIEKHLKTLRSYSFE